MIFGGQVWRKQGGEAGDAVPLIRKVSRINMNPMSK
jgi:hypothetical protein